MCLLTTSNKAHGPLSFYMALLPTTFFILATQDCWGLPLNSTTTLTGCNNHSHGNASRAHNIKKILGEFIATEQPTMHLAPEKKTTLAVTKQLLDERRNHLKKLRKEVEQTKPMAPAAHFIADLYTDLFFGKSLELFSDRDFDSYGFLQQTIDVGFDITSCINNEHSQWLEFLGIARAKAIFGNTDAFNKFIPKPIKMGVARTENNFTPTLVNETIFLREAWLSYHIGNFYPTSLTVGFFPYRLGYGLIVGNAHNVGITIPGQYYERFVDQFRPGILLSGTVRPKKLWYDFYVGFINAKNTSFFQTAEFIRAQEIARRFTPFRGSGSTNIFGLLQVQWEWRNECKQRFLTIAPFILFNNDLEQQVEILGDAKSFLGIAGAELNYKTPCYSVHLEGALNFGEQMVKAIDRNRFFAVAGTEQSHLFQSYCTSTVITSTCFAVATQQTFPEDTAFDKPNGAIFKDATGTTFQNSFDRFRNAYTNKYRGWMVLGDITLKFRQTDWCKQCVSLMAGIASGDENPNDSVEKILANRFNPDTSIYLDHNKCYKGFIGIEQMYAGCGTQPVFMLEAQKLNRPLSQLNDQLTFQEFTNLGVLGAAYHINYTRKQHTVSIDANFFAYFQPHTTRKGFNYTLDTLFISNACPTRFTEEMLPGLAQDAAHCLCQFLGIELNAFISYKISKQFNWYCNPAIFIPGSYYTSALGKIIPLSLQFKLDQPDFSGFESSQKKFDIALENNIAFLVNIGFEYIFDSTIRK